MLYVYMQLIKNIPPTHTPNHNTVWLEASDGKSFINLANSIENWEMSHAHTHTISAKEKEKTQPNQYQLWFAIAEWEKK